MRDEIVIDGVRYRRVEEQGKVKPKARGRELAEELVNIETNSYAETVAEYAVAIDAEIERAKIGTYSAQWVRERMDDMFAMASPFAGKSPEELAPLTWASICELIRIKAMREQREADAELIGLANPQLAAAIRNQKP